MDVEGGLLIIYLLRTIGPVYVFFGLLIYNMSDLHIYDISLVFTF